MKELIEKLKLELEDQSRYGRIHRLARGPEDLHQLLSLHHGTRQAAHQMSLDRELSRSKPRPWKIQQHRLKQKWNAMAAKRHGDAADRLAKSTSGVGLLRLRRKTETWAGGMGAGVANHFEPDTDSDLQQTVQFDTGDDLWTVAPPSTRPTKSTSGRPDTWRRRNP